MGGRPENLPEGFDPEKFKPENMPEGMTPPEMPEGGVMPQQGQRPQGGNRPAGRGDRGQAETAEVSDEFAITAGGSYFSNVREISK